MKTGNRILCLSIAGVLAASAVALGQVEQGLASLSDDVLLNDLARRKLPALLERAFEQRNTPAEVRDGFRATMALADLARGIDSRSPAEVRPKVQKVIAGIRQILPRQTDPQTLYDQSQILIRAGLDRESHTLEYWGPSLTTQAAARPVAETVIQMLDRTCQLTDAAVEKLASSIAANDERGSQRIARVEDLGLLAAQSRALCQYYLALSVDPVDPLRTSSADAAIKYLEPFDSDDNPNRGFLRLVLAKLHTVKNTPTDFATARKIYAELIKTGIDATPPEGIDPAEFEQANRSQLFEAHYFAAVVEILAGEARAARGRYDALLAWQHANPADPAASETANQLLAYRILNLESASATGATRDKLRAESARLLISIVQARPDLETLITQQLLSGVNETTPMNELEPLLLGAILSRGTDNIAQAGDDKSKFDRAVLDRAIAAGREILTRKDVDARLVADAEYFLPFCLECVGQSLPAIDGYIAYAQKYAQKDKTRADLALTAAQSLIATIRQDPEQVDLPATATAYDKVLRTSVDPPFSQSQFANFYASRLLGLRKYADAARYFRMVLAKDSSYAASRYFLLVCLSNELENTDAGTRAAIVAEMQKLADEVRDIAAGRASSGEEKARAVMQSRAARASLMAADAARSDQNPQRAIERLRDFESQIASSRDADQLLGEAMFIRVQSNMALGNTDAAVKQLVDLLNQSGGTKGAAIVFNMLSKLEEDFNSASAADNRPRMAQLQASRAALTPYLVSWAQGSSSPEIKKFTYSYRVYDADTQRLAAEFITDPAEQKSRRQSALSLFEGLNADAGRAAYRESRGGALPNPRIAYDPQVALGIARIHFDLADFPAARDKFGRLIADKALGSNIMIVRDAGQAREVDNDAYWESIYKWLSASVSAGDPREPLQGFLKEQIIRFGDRVGGTLWKAQFAALRLELLPGFDPMQIQIEPEAIPATTPAMPEPPTPGN